MAHKKGHYGSGTIAPSGKNSWRIRYRIGGERFAKTIKGTKTEAGRELRRLLQAGDEGRHVAPDGITLRQWIDQWTALLERRPVDDGENRRRRGLVNARTLERYEQLLRTNVVPTLGDKPLQKIIPTDIDNLYIDLEKTKAPRTVHHVHVVLGACLKSAVKKKLIQVSPVAGAEAPSPGESDHGMVLDEMQLTELVAGFKESVIYPIVFIAASTGMRRNEILALRWSDLSFEDKTITVARAVEETKKHGRGTKEPKTQRGRRTIKIDNGLIEVLAAERERHLRLVAGIPDGADVDLSLVKLPDRALMFPGGWGADLTKLRHGHAVTSLFKIWARKLGFPNLRFHDLRGSHATLLLDKRVPVHVVAARGGHDPAVLLRAYAKRTRKADTEAADVISGLSAGILGRGRK
jgi:integrase